MLFSSGFSLSFAVAIHYNHVDMGRNDKNIIRIATRESQLALKQAEMVRDSLLAADASLGPEQVELLPMTTSGDQQQHKDIAQWGYKGLFTKEIEEALLDGRADLAVHSMKDMPSELPDGLIIDGMLEREDPRDAFISVKYDSFESLPEGATVGCSSVRRSALLKYHRPDLNIIPFRGNVNTRLRKLSEGEADATLLAVAGLKRIGLDAHITHAFEPNIMLPAVAQGAIGIECREDDADIRERLKSISHGPTITAVECERALLKRVDGSCKTPLCGYATIGGEQIHLKALLAHPDGIATWEAQASGAIADAKAIGTTVAEALLNQAGDVSFLS